MKYFVPLFLASAGCVLLLVTTIDLAGVSIPGLEATALQEVDDLPSAASSGDFSADPDLGGSASAPKLVLMKFGAPWCPPCRMVDKELKKLDRKGLPVEIRKINVDQQQAMARRYGVSSIPRLILLEDGRKIGDEVGYQSSEELSDWISGLASKEALAAEKRPSGRSVVHVNPFVK